MRHLLRGNKSCRQPARHVFLDTESYRNACDDYPASELHTLRCWCAESISLRKGEVSTHLSASGTCFASFWRWLSSRLCKDRSTWIWAHNAGYDFTTLLGWQRIERGTIEYSLFVAEQGLWILKGKLLGKPFVWVDSLNWLKWPLAQLAQWCNTEKLSLPDDDDSEDTWLDRCAHDVEILRTAVLKLLHWHKENDLGVFAYTVSGQSLRLWRHRLGPIMPDEELYTRQRQRKTSDERPFIYPQIHASATALAMERESYHGPCCAVYRVGMVDGPVYALDIQSCYPALMYGRPYPCRLISRLECPSVARLKQLLDHYGIVGAVTLKDCPYEFPTKVDGTSCRCIGDGIACLPAPELRHLAEIDCIASVGVVYLYQEMQLFNDYVDYVTCLRDGAKAQNDAVAESVIKLLANSIYGKFGQRSGKWQDTNRKVASPLWGERFAFDSSKAQWRRMRYIGGHEQEELSGNEAPCSFPAIPAYVTSYARLAMDKLQAIAGVGHYYYSYSDSIHVDEVGYQRLLDASEVLLGERGKLRVQAVYDWVHYYAAGRYEANDGRHMAGLSHTHWIQDDGKLAHWHFASPAEVITSRLHDGKPLPGVLVSEESYGTNESAGHRIIGEDGWTKPRKLTIGE